MTLHNKRAVITGGGTGIGLGIAHALAREGCHVAIAGRREQTLQDAVGAFRGDPPLRFHPVDVADRASVAKLFEWVEQALGPVDILVNSAGMNVKDRSLTDTKPEEWDRVLAVNATGAFNCMTAVLPQMRQRRDGVVINISSIAGKRATPLGGVAYNASKFAMTALGTSAWLEEAKNNIRITNIYPGEVNTPILENRPQPVSDERKAAMLQPEDVAAVVLAIIKLPPRAHVPEMVIKPTTQDYV
ncbi:MAG: SDR family oxidoreductase [Planctomycetes bacterium]|nr:SDR family oxidoreductase [Planctomycetota bacterium]